VPRPRVLVIEDDPRFVDVLERFLTKKGFAVTVTMSGDQALWALNRAHPDVAVIDVMIPHPDGLEVCSELRNAGWRGPIAVISARANDRDHDAALHAGADVFVAKPFRLADLEATLRCLLEGRRERQAPPS
jgi:DNA-binding response OmpR family regulator